MMESVWKHKLKLQPQKEERKVKFYSWNPEVSLKDYLVGNNRQEETSGLAQQTYFSMLSRNCLLICFYISITLIIHPSSFSCICCRGGRMNLKVLHCGLPFWFFTTFSKSEWYMLFLSFFPCMHMHLA